MEYRSSILMMIVGVLIGFMWGYLWEISTDVLRVQQLAIQAGYHFHHSLFGIFALLITPFVKKRMHIILIIGFAIGVIAQHYVMSDPYFVSKTINDGLYFVPIE